ncbi:MAG: ABC transporter substrate-binding protein [Bauldia sp.]
MVGFLSAQAQSYQCRFVDGMRDRGYVPGEDVLFDFEFVGGADAALAEAAAALIARGVDVIVATSSSATEAAMAATAAQNDRTPIVMVTTGDPVGQGYILSLSRPGGNVTGQSMLAPELGAKQLEYLRYVAPEARRVAVIWNSRNGADRLTLELLPAAATALGFELLPVEVQGPDQIAAAFALAEAGGADSLIVLIDQVTIRNRVAVVAEANARSWPAVYPLEEFVFDGGLLSYGVSFGDLYYNAAGATDRMLRGADPAIEPVQQATNFFLYVNRDTATAQGVVIPDWIAYNADGVLPLEPRLGADPEPAIAQRFPPGC